MLIWKTLHILSMVTMISVFIGAEIFYAAAIWRRDVRALAFVQGTLERFGLGAVAIIGLLAGIVFGLLAAANGGFDYTAGWLIVAYVLVVAFFVNAAVIGAKVVRVGKAAIEAETGARSPEEVFGGMPRNRGAVLIGVNIIIFAAIIADMVLKPF